MVTLCEKLCSYITDGHASPKHGVSNNGGSIGHNTFFLHELEIVGSWKQHGDKCGDFRE